MTRGRDGTLELVVEAELAAADPARLVELVPPSRIFMTDIGGPDKPQSKVIPTEMLHLDTSIPPAAEPNPLGVLGGENAGPTT